MCYTVRAVEGASPYDLRDKIGKSTALRMREQYEFVGVGAFDDPRALEPLTAWDHTYSTFEQSGRPMVAPTMTSARIFSPKNSILNRAGVQKGSVSPKMPDF